MFSKGKEPLNKYAPKNLNDHFRRLKNVTLPEGNDFQEGKTLHLSRKKPNFWEEIRRGKNPWRSKYTADWFVKKELEEEQLTSEVIIADAFKVMMQRVNLAPKIRVGILGAENYTLSKKIKNFKVWASVTNSSAEADGSQVVNYYHMLAVCLLLGQYDVHPGNWGIVKQKGKKWAAVIDHGRSITKGHIQLSQDAAVMLLLGHKSEHLISKEFLTALLVVADEAEEKKEALRQALFSGLERVRAAGLHGASTITLESLLADIEVNSASLRMVAFSVEIQLAMEHLDIEAFRSLLQDVRFSHVVKNWQQMCIRPAQNNELDYLFSLITEEGVHYLRELTFFQRLRNSVYLNNSFYFRRQREYLNTLYNDPNSPYPEDLILAVYNTFSLEEKKRVDDELNACVNRFQPFRDAYLEAKKEWSEENVSSLGL